MESKEQTISIFFLSSLFRNNFDIICTEGDPKELDELRIKGTGGTEWTNFLKKKLYIVPIVPCAE